MTARAPRLVATTTDAPPAAGASAPARPRNPLSASGWSGISFIIANLIGSLIYIPMARHLAPTDYGVYAQANLLYLGASLFAEGAVTQALIQVRGDIRRLAHAAFWLSALLGITGASLCLLGAPLMLHIYGEAQLVPLLTLMSVGVLAGGLGVVPHALLARDLNFRQKTVPESVAVAVGGLAGLAAAIAGLGVYSLAVMTIVQSFISTIGAWLVCRPARALLWRRDADGPGRLPDGEALTRLIRVFSGISISDLARYARLNTDFALGGRILGAASLGVYSLAWSTSAGPLLFILSFSGRPLFAVFSALQQDRARLREVFLAAVRVIAGVTAPVFGVAIVITPDLVPFALGSKWLAVTTPLMVLFFLQMLRAICSVGGSTVLALGYSQVYGVVGLLVLPATVVAVLIGARWGVTGLAVAMLIAVSLVNFIYFGIALRLLRIGPRRLLGAFTLAAPFVLAAVPAALAARLGATALDAPLVVRLLAAISAALVAMAVAGYWRQRQLAHDIAVIRHALAGEAPDGATANPRLLAVQSHPNA